MLSLQGWFHTDPNEIFPKTLPAPLGDRVSRWDALGETHEVAGFSWKPALLKEVELYGSGVLFRRGGRGIIRDIFVRVPPRKRLPKLPIRPDPSAAIKFVSTQRVLPGDLDEPPTPKPQLIWFDPSIVLGEIGPVVLAWRFSFHGERPQDLIISLDGTTVLAAIALDPENSYTYTTTPRFLLDPLTGVPRFVSFVPPLVLPQAGSGSPVAVAEEFFRRFPAMFGTGEPSQQLQIKRIESDLDKGHHVIFQQIYAGLRVWGCELSVHLNDQLAITSISGRYYRDPDVDLTPTFSEQMAYSLAMTHWQGVNGDRLGPGQNVEQRGLVILPWRLTAPKEWNSLTWWFRFPDADRFISAETGRLIVAISREPSVRKIFDQGGRVLDDNPELQLEDGVQRTPNALDPEALVADGATAAIEGFWRILGRNSWDGGGADTLVYLETNWDNPITPPPDVEVDAKWNGSCTSFSRDFAEPDVIGHEFTHALTEKTAGLVYLFESGALNESFSDVFGKLIFRTPQPWIIGQATLSRDLQNGTFRNPPIPTGMVTNMSTNYANFMFMTATTDSGGVHFNSGIGNRAAVLVADGDGTAAHPGLGRERLARIWWDTLKTTLSPWSSYIDLVVNAWHVTRKLADGTRHGVQLPGSTTQAPVFTSDDPNQVLWAFQNVGLDLQLLTGWFRVPYDKTTPYVFYRGMFTEANEVVSDVIVRLTQRKGVGGTRFLGNLQVSTGTTTSSFFGGMVTASITSHGVNSQSRQVDVTVTTQNFADLEVSCQEVIVQTAPGPMPTPPTLPFPTPRVAHWFDVPFFGKRYGDIIFEVTDLMPGCTVSDVQLELLERNGSVVPGGITRFGQPPAAEGGRGAWIFASSVGGTKIEVKVRSWHDFGTAVRYRLVYWIRGLNCVLPNFTIREVDPNSL